MAYQPIQNYGLIGDLHTAALVGTDGSIDWLCFPSFDSPSVFGAILDDKKGGRFKISPLAENATYKQVYWPDTNVLITRFLSPDGHLQLGRLALFSLLRPWYWPALLEMGENSRKASQSMAESLHEFLR